jgi:hypothetical protein
MEQGEAGQGEEYEARRRDPVVDARCRGVTVDRDRIARMDLLAWPDVIGLFHHRPPG